MNIFFEKIKSFFVKCGISIKNFFLKIVNALKKSSQTDEEKQRKKEEKLREKAEKKARKQEEKELKKAEKQNKSLNKVVAVFLNIFDVIFDVAFFCGIFFILRPDFLSVEKTSFAKSWNLDGFKFWLLIIDKEKSEFLYSNASIFVIFLSFAFYFLYKLVFSFITSSKNVNKAISILFILMNFASLLLLKDKFLIFLIFYILLFVTFQILSGINFKVFLIKLLCIFILSFVLYIVLLSIFSPTFRITISVLYQEMLLPKKCF